MKVVQTSQCHRASQERGLWVHLSKNKVVALNWLGPSRSSMREGLWEQAQAPMNTVPCLTRKLVEQILSY